MVESKDLISVYSGTEASVLLLKTRLDRLGVSSMISKDSNAGTWGIVSEHISLLIDPGDREEAQPVIKEFMHNDKVDKL